jgi:hypothetical protein
MTEIIKKMAAAAAVNRNEKEAAARLGVSVHSLRRWRVCGGGPRFLKMGSRIIYPESELEAYEAACLRRSTSDTGTAAQQAQAVKQTAKVRSISSGNGKCSNGFASPENGVRGGIYDDLA